MSWPATARERSIIPAPSADIEVLYATLNSTRQINVRERSRHLRSLPQLPVRADEMARVAVRYAKPRELFATRGHLPFQPVGAPSAP
jgi:hypothetical protein